eukprot:COSAG01_NODE_6013_length_3901_cov_11.941610_6_plen_103_part_00
MIGFMTYVLASAVTGPTTPINAITPINTSLGTIPTGYFGGAKNGTRSDGDIAQLAKMRLVWIEKWEGEGRHGNQPARGRLPTPAAHAASLSRIAQDPAGTSA